MSRKREPYSVWKRDTFVRVRWVDIVADSSWQDFSNEEEKGVHDCVSFGFITRNNKHGITLSATRGVNGSVEYNQSINIPWGVISDISEVKID